MAIAARVDNIRCPANLIDVAMVARVMWREVLTPALRRRIVAGLDLDEDAAERWVAFLAGLHDVGKASPVFQAKDPSAQDRLRSAGLTWALLGDDPRQGIISSIAIEQYLSGACGVDIEVA